MQPDLIGGRYKVIRSVGRGGMGTVWLCRDEVLHRDVAVKQVNPLPGEAAATAVRAMREARLSAALNHENAVSIYDIVDFEGSPWLVMEYVPSRTLSAILREEGPLSVPRVARIGAQLASALASAHALGIIHRDVKPGNVLIGKNDLAKISDFGIARGHFDERFTLTGLMTGTPSYFSPELARGGDPNQASDVWALGATLYAAVEGGPPYGSHPNPLALLARIASEPPPPPTHAGKLTRTLARMLDRNPTTRMSMLGALAALNTLTSPYDKSAARARERDRAYSDTTLSEQPVGVLDAMMATAAITPAEPTPAVPAELSPADPTPAEPTPAELTPADPTPAEPTSVEPTSVEPADLAVTGTGDVAWRDESRPPPVPAVAPAAVVPASGGSSARRGAGRPSLTLVTVGLAAILVLAIAGALLWALLSSPATSPQSSPQTTPTGPASQPGKPTTGAPTTAATTAPRSTPTRTLPTSPPPSTKAPPTSPSAPPTSPKPPLPPPSSGQAMVSFVTSYFNTVPGDTATGWSELAPSMQSVGRDSYERFWESIDSVDVAGARAVAGAQAVEFDITYHFSDGRVVLEHQRIDLAPHAGSYWITNDTVLSSTG